MKIYWRMQTFIMCTKIVFNRRKKVIQVWNDIRVSKWWKNWIIIKFDIVSHRIKWPRRTTDPRERHNGVCTPSQEPCRAESLWEPAARPRDSCTAQNQNLHTHIIFTLIWDDEESKLLQTCDQNTPVKHQSLLHINSALDIMFTDFSSGVITLTFMKVHLRASARFHSAECSVVWGPDERCSSRGETEERMLTHTHTHTHAWDTSCLLIWISLYQSFYHSRSFV